MIWPFKPGKLRQASKIRIKPPEPATDRHGLAIVLIARDEAARIHDWLTFHALAGARSVILYDNMSTDNTVEIAQRFTGMNVTIVPWQLHTHIKRPPCILPRQTLAYCHAISTFGAQFRWMSFIDTDEFIVPRDDSTIEQALAKIGDFSNISMPWTMFGHAGNDLPTKDPVPFTYNMRASAANGPLLNFKCIVDPCKVTQVGVHQFETSDMGHQTVNTRGQVTGNRQRKASAFVSTDVLQLNHYYLMSRADTEAKINGGAISGTAIDKRAASVHAKAQLIEANPVRDNAAMSFLARHAIHNDQDFRKKFQNQHA